MDKEDLLLEIGCEELPTAMVATLSLELEKKIRERLKSAKLISEKDDETESKVFATPRRLAVCFHGVKNQAETQWIERLGPGEKQAYDAQGQPTPATLGFARSCGVEASQLSLKETEKGKQLFYAAEKPGLTAVEILPELIQSAVAALPIARPMRWGSHTFSFARPAHWIVLLFGKKIVPANFFGLSAGNQTRGHRFHHPEPLTIADPKHYASLLLEKGRVAANYFDRKNKIRELVQKETPAGCQASMDESLLEEVTSLVEWPVALLGRFNPDFLKIPAEALITSMQVNQKYFPVRKEGKLQPLFIIISNIESKNRDAVIRGNERVINARLTDAAFFYQNDCARTLESRLLQLEAVTFQKQLGSLAAKTERITALSGWIAEKIGADIAATKQAAQLSKCDLMSEMVGEFPTLQGVMGYHYALNDGLSETCALAIKEHYSPRFSGDALPSQLEGCAVALADKLDTLIGIFGINQAPTGDKDPFALRRAALGVLRILIEKTLPLDLKELLQQAQKNYATHLPNANTVQQTLDFMTSRLQAWFLERGKTSEQINAVLASGTTQPLDFAHRLNAIEIFQQLPEAAALSAANKRVSNILKKQAIENLPPINSSLFEHDAERQLGKLLETETKTIHALCRESKYAEALSKLAAFKEPVDLFFDKVMVMAENEALRNNRLALLSALHHLFTQVADISLL